MATSSESVIVNNSEPIGNGDTHLVAINAGSQFPLKLTPSNFPSWRAQLMSLLIGYDLQGYLDGTIICPSSTLPTSTSSSAVVPNPAYWHWFRQDKLLLHAILASVSEPVMPLIASSSTAHDAWSKLQRLYANRSRTRVMQLKEELTLIQRESRSVSEYLHAIKALVDELAVIDSLVSADDITLYVLNGLGPEFRDIATPIQARETSLTFEELHDMLVGHENYLKRIEAFNSSLVATANSTQRHPASSKSKTFKYRNKRLLYYRVAVL
ncbi:hypothetical protein F2P56_023787 [Juglans regia]|uniref:Retrovirus-related Pol polyprotein from transposon RE1 n=1 Tax=Juglans regia TaxID=51240 RepID=A0A833U631_JUGRE|nr:hypothetical protein F2P56_023787 [Juglans regia]